MDMLENQENANNLLPKDAGTIFTNEYCQIDQATFQCHQHPSNGSSPYTLHYKTFSTLF